LEKHQIVPIGEKKQSLARWGEESPSEFHWRIRREFRWLGFGGGEWEWWGSEGWVGVIRLGVDNPEQG